MSARDRRSKARRRHRRAAALSGTLATSVAFGFAGPAGAADVTASLIKDLNPVEDGARPADITQVGGVFYYRADDGESGNELWKSDGTPGGTALLKDIQPGQYGGTPTNLTNVNGTLFFSARNNESGTELWKSDGTAAGTVLVTEIRPGSYGGYPGSLVNAGGTLFFSAQTESEGTELWKSDGTPAGTVRIKDINFGSGSSGPGNLTAVGSSVFFAANDGTNGMELWKSNGSSLGTTEVENIKAGGLGSYPSQLVNVAGDVYFVADDGTGTSNELWISDGTLAGTDLLKDINPTVNVPGDVTSPVNVNGTLMFAANDGTDGGELWKSNGTPVTTVPVADINVGPGSGAATGKYETVLANVNGTLYFVGDDGSTGQELWKSNGTAVTTVPVKDINPGSGHGFRRNKYGRPTALAAIGTTVYFVANDGTTGGELWKSGGTEATTVPVKDIQLGVKGAFGAKYAALHNVGGTLVFAANDGTTGSELWHSDGTEAGTTQVKNARTASEDGTEGGYYEPATAAAGGALFFSGTDGAVGRELFKSDGTAAGTVLVKDIATGTTAQDEPESGDPRNMTSVGDTLFFRANDASAGEELWRSDGTAAGTTRVEDIRPGTESGSPRSLTNLGGVLLFVADDGTNGRALWRSDGTEPGTFMVEDASGASSGTFSSFTEVGGILYFATETAGEGLELWRSDGTPDGTFRLTDINPVAGNSDPAGLVNAAGTLMFSANDGTAGRELWRSDGTPGGTIPLGDINPGAGSGIDSVVPGAAVNLGSLLLFNADDGIRGRELWKSDGTLAGTVPVKDINPGAGPSNPGDMVAVGRQVYFSANDGTSGSELWMSDGTTEGTVRAADINPGAAHSYPDHLTNLDGTLVFAANDGTSGSELWEAALTRVERAADTRPGAAGGAPADFVAAGRSLFFTADNGLTGRELWMGKLPPLPSASPSPSPTATVKRRPRLRVRVKPRRDRRSPFRFKLVGTLVLPDGVSAAQGCAGPVGVTGRKKGVRKSVFFKRTRVGSACKFRVKAKLKKRAGRRGRATFRFAFRGNTVLLPASKSVRVRFGQRKRAPAK